MEFKHISELKSGDVFKKIDNGRVTIIYEVKISENRIKCFYWVNLYGRKVKSFNSYSFDFFIINFSLYKLAKRVKPPKSNFILFYDKNYKRPSL